MHIAGMDKFKLKNDMKLKDAAKALGKRFACSTTIKELPNNDKEIQVQGDCRYEIADVLESSFGIPSNKVFIDEDSGKKKVKEPKAPPAQPDRGGGSDE
jgi:translation initiation factor 1 (eIF-1/SUI1)